MPLQIASVRLHFAQVVTRAKRATLSFQYHHTHARVIADCIQLGLQCGKQIAGERVELGRAVEHQRRNPVAC